jgi:homoserine dehydrogenase
MERKGVSFETALARAQAKGFAEADPTLDINGWDAAHKALILAMLAYGTPISPDRISVYGIERVTACDFRFAHQMGYTIKLLVVIKQHADSDRLELRVQPSFVPREHLLANVNGVFNAIAVKGDIVGETIFYGRGAGKNPTASAVIGDIVMAMRDLRHPETHTGFRPYTKTLDVMPQEDTVTPYYVRFLVPSRRSGIIAAIAQGLAKHDISIASTYSSAHEDEEAENVQNDLVFTLHACPWGTLKTALKEIVASGCVAPHPAVFRIETFNS